MNGGAMSTPARNGLSPTDPPRSDLTFVVLEKLLV